MPHYYDPLQKPEAGTPLDTEHWASQASLFLPMWDGAGKSVEDLSGNSNIGILNSGVKWVDKGLQFDGSTGICTLTNIVKGSVNRTLWAIIDAASIGTIQFISSNDNGALTPSRIWQFRLDASGILRTIFFSTNNTNGQAIGSIVVAGAGPTLVVATWDGVTIRNYVNGIPDGSVAFSGPLTNVATAVPTIGNGVLGSQGGAAAFKGKIIVFGDLPFTASPVQIKELSERPYSLFIQKQRVLPLQNRKSTVLRPRGPTWRTVTDDTQKPEAGTPVNIDHWASNAALILPCWDGAGKSVEDVSGNGNTGLLNSGVLCQDNGLKFDATTGVVTFADSPRLHQSTKLAVHIRFKGTVGTLAARFNAIEAGSPWAVRFFNGKIQFFTDSGLGGFDLTGSKSVDDGKTHDIWCLYDATIATPTKWIYVDGKFDASTVANVASSLTSCTTPLTLGHATALTFFDGVIESLAIYDNLPTADQIKELYEHPYALFTPNRRGSSTSLAPAKNYSSSKKNLPLSDPTQKPMAGTPINIEHWASNASLILPMWDGAGKSVEDVSGNNNLGTLNSGVSWSSGIEEIGLKTDGNTGFISISDSPFLHFGTNDFWIRVRVVVNATQASLNPTLVDKRTNGGSFTGASLYLASKTTPAFQLNTSGVNNFTPTGPAINDGKPHTIDFVVSRSAAIAKIFVDGIKTSTTDISTSVKGDSLTSVNSLRIGEGVDGNNPASAIFLGLMISQFAPTDTQITNLTTNPYELFSAPQLQPQFFKASSQNIIQFLIDTLSLTDASVESISRLRLIADTIDFTDMAAILANPAFLYYTTIRNILLGGGLDE